jgi:hypothetical protein
MTDQDTAMVFDQRLLLPQNYLDLIAYLEAGHEEIPPALRQHLIGLVKKFSKGPRKVSAWYAEGVLWCYQEEIRSLIAREPAQGPRGLGLKEKLVRLGCAIVDIRGEIITEAPQGEITEAAKELACDELKLSPSGLDGLLRKTKRKSKRKNVK